MKIVFMGTPEFAVPSLEACVANEMEIAGVVTRPDRPKGRGLKVFPPPVKIVAEKLGIPVLQPEKIKAAEFMDRFREMNPELAVVAAYGKILPGDLLAAAPLGFINVHASLLPKYRGASPIEWAIINGERLSGVTIMKLTEGMDEGPMIIQESTPIGDDETAGDLEARLSVLGGKLLAQALEMFKGGKVEMAEQDHSLATYAHRLKKEDGLVKWEMAARKIKDMIRGLNPWPCAHTLFREKGLNLIEGKVAGEECSGQPGVIERIEKEGPVVATGKGSVVLLKVQPESRNQISGADFARGYRVVPGENLG